MRKTFQALSLLGILALCTSASFTGDLGFRFKDGKCVNEKGTEGLNPAFFGQCADLKGVVLGRFNLDGIDFSGSDFSSADLQKTTLNESNLTGVTFDNANLAGVEFKGAKISSSSFKKAVLRNAVMAEALIETSDFSEADFSNSVLSYMTAPGSKFVKTRFLKSQLDSSQFQKSNFEGADFSEANLAEADFSEANFNFAKMKGTDLNQVNFSQVSANNGKFKSANFVNANLKGTSFVATELRKARLKGAVVEKTNLEGADLRGADLSNVDIKNVNVKKALFSRKTLLPLKKEEAEQLGMIFKTGGGVLILWEEKTTGIDELKKAIETSGNDATLYDKVGYEFDGKKIEEYEAVFFFNTNNYTTNMNPSGQKALVDFVKEGGLFITTEWSSYAVDQAGNLKDMVDLILSTYVTSVSGRISFIPTAEKNEHPIFTGLDSNDSFDSGYVTSGMRKFNDQPSELLAELPDGTDILGMRKFGEGTIVGFFFSCDSNCTGNKTVHKLFVNALNAFL